MEQRTFDELISNFNSTISKWEIDLKYKFKLLGMIADIGYEHKKMLNNLPSAEPVIIRCKDCKHHSIQYDQDWCYGRRVTPEFFCGYAERRTNEND